jgi:hypothetical protein
MYILLAGYLQGKRNKKSWIYFFGIYFDDILDTTVYDLLQDLDLWKRRIVFGRGVS